MPEVGPLAANAPVKVKRPSLNLSDYLFIAMFFWSECTYGFICALAMYAATIELCTDCLYIKSTFLKMAETYGECC